jgi:hypothetical protein
VDDLLDLVMELQQSLTDGSPVLEKEEEGWLDWGIRMLKEYGPAAMSIASKVAAMV